MLELALIIALPIILLVLWTLGLARRSCSLGLAGVGVAYALGGADQWHSDFGLAGVFGGVILTVAGLLLFGHGCLTDLRKDLEDTINTAYHKLDKRVKRLEADAEHKDQEQSTSVGEGG